MQGEVELAEEPCQTIALEEASQQLACMCPAAMGALPPCFGMLFSVGNRHSKLL